MGLTMRERKAVTNELAHRYQRATKSERGRLLQEFTRLTGYSRCYASHILHNWGTRQIRIVDGERVQVIIGATPAAPRHRRRPPLYDEAFTTILERLWAIADGLCGKRLRVFIRGALPLLERFGEVTIPDELFRAKLLTISPASIDRLLKPARRKLAAKARARTKPGTLLKHHIPVRTFADWNEQICGFLEIDLVAHDGGSASGDFIQTLDATDIATAWTETRAVRTKAQRWVLGALCDIKRQLPFPLLGIDSDNGGEFINNHLLRFCEASHLTFTRSRPYRKNDSCYVEQKNYTVVRRTVGYYRYDNDDQLRLLEELYGHLRLYTNFFQPVMKLVSKTRVGSTVSKKYDEPQTPLVRLLAQPSVPQQTKDQLSALFEQLNPAELKRSIARLQETLFASRSPLPQRPLHILHPPNHPWRQTDPRCKNLFPLALRVDSQKSNPHTLPQIARKPPP
jgi:hypothetical protein